MNVVRGLLWLVAAVACVRSVSVVVTHFASGIALPPGEGLLPPYTDRLAYWCLAGTVAWVCAARGLSEFPTDALADRAARGRDAIWVAALSGVALVAAVAVRWAALGGTDVGLDEAAYRFQASLLLHGVAWVPSPPDKIAFDTVPMINDGRWYPPHPPGWPLLMAPFHAVGAAGLAAPVLLAATVPAVFLVARRWLGSGWARLAGALFATAPMAVLGAATELPGTSLAFVAAWSLWAVERARDPDAPPWTDPLVGLLVGLGVAIDGPTGAGLGVVIVVARLADRPSPRRLAAFAAPALVLVAAVLALQVARTGSPWVSGWQRVFQYAAENGWRFTWIDRKIPGPVPHMRFEAWRVVVMPVAAAFRVSLESLGWPMGLVPVLFVAPSRAARLCAAVAVGLLVPNVFLVDLGTGVYGPERVHALLVPAVLATVLGLAAIRAWNPSPEWGRTLGALVAAAALVSAIGYVPMRVDSMASVAQHFYRPLFATSRIHDAVVFVRDAMYSPACDGEVWRLSVRRPVGDPWLRDDVVWVNRVAPDVERRIMTEQFSGRRAYRLVWNLESCKVRAERLEPGIDGPLPKRHSPDD